MRIALRSSPAFIVVNRSVWQVMCMRGQVHVNHKLFRKISAEVHEFPGSQRLAPPELTQQIDLRDLTSVGGYHMVTNTMAWL